MSYEIALLIYTSRVLSLNTIYYDAFR